MNNYFKIITILTLFLSSIFHAQDYTATIYLKNGSVKKGKANAAINGETKLAFKEENSTKKEKIDVMTIDKVEYLDPKTNETITLEFKEFIYYVFSDKPKTEYNWMRKLSSGDISLYVSDSYDPGLKSNGYYYTSTPSNLTNYFFQYKDEKPAMIYFINSTWTPNKKSLVKKHVKNFFQNLCPELVNDFENENIVIKDHKVDVLIKYYEEKCSKSSK